MLLCEAAWQAVRRSPAMRAFFERVTRGEPGRKKIALVADGPQAGAVDGGDAAERRGVAASRSQEQEQDPGLTAPAPLRKTPQAA